MSITVDHAKEERIEYEPGTVTDLHKHLHDKLDTLIDRMIEHGGAAVNVACSLGGEEIVLRLTLCDFTGETTCAFCDGTGVATDLEPTQ